MFITPRKAEDRQTIQIRAATRSAMSAHSENDRGKQPDLRADSSLPLRDAVGDEPAPHGEEEVRGRLDGRRDAEVEREPVSFRTSHAIATTCIQLPAIETTCPTKYRR